MHGGDTPSEVAVRGPLTEVTNTINQSAAPYTADFINPTPYAEVWKSTKAKRPLNFLKEESLLSALIPLEELEFFF